MKKIKFMLMTVMICMLLGGCTKREIEDRTFPTVLVFTSPDFVSEQAERQKASTDYIDYGHVKALILSEEMATNSESLKEVLVYLEGRPVFANNLLVFIGDKQVLKEAKDDEGKLGLYLEDMYKNQPRDAEFPKTILKDMLNYLHNSEDHINVPYLQVEDEKILPTEQIELTQEAMPAMNSPILRRINE